MPHLHIVVDVERQAFDALDALGVNEGGAMEGRLHELIADGKVIHMGEGSQIEIGGLEAGMASGKPSVMFCFQLPDAGAVVIAETSLALLVTATKALTARYGDPTL